MALIDVTPIMTSDTTPSPYIVTASSISGGNAGWKAFDNDTSNISNGSYWGTEAGKQNNSWLQLRFNKKTKVNMFSIISHSATNTAPKKFDICGSNDAVNWIKFKEYDFSEWTGEQKHLFFEFDNDSEYLYYRLNIVENNGNPNYTYICEMKYYYDDTKVEYVSYKNASLSYTIPMNTTSKILSKRNDPREGLLGMSNDSDNYGDLYVVGKDGKSHLTKAGMKSEIIFEGNITTVGEYSLTKKASLFKKLIISYIVAGQYRDTMVVNVDEIIMDETRYQIVGFQNAKAIVRFKDDITLVDQSHDNTGFVITKIIGIY